MRSILLSVAALLFLSSPLFAAEVENLSSGQDGRRAYVQYDLLGKAGESGADIVVAVELDGKAFQARKLTGDLGKGIQIGTGKKIFWDLLEDLPQGFEGAIRWHVDASSGWGQFVVSELTVVDGRTGLMWVRDANLPRKKLSYGASLTYAKTMNRQKYGGYDDWRIPSRREAKTLLDSIGTLAESTGKKPLQVVKSLFNEYQSSYYWIRDFGSSMFSAATHGFDFEDGDFRMAPRNEEYCVVPVRGGETN